MEYMLIKRKVFRCFSIIISYCFQWSALLFHNHVSSPAFNGFDYTIKLRIGPVSKNTKLRIFMLTDFPSGYTST